MIPCKIIWIFWFKVWFPDNLIHAIWSRQFDPDNLIQFDNVGFEIKLIWSFYSKLIEYPPWWVPSRLRFRLMVKSWAATSKMDQRVYWTHSIIKDLAGWNVPITYILGLPVWNLQSLDRLLLSTYWVVFSRILFVVYFRNFLFRWKLEILWYFRFNFSFFFLIEHCLRQISCNYSADLRGLMVNIHFYSS